MWKVVTHWVLINDLKIGKDKEEHCFQTEKITSYKQIGKHIKKQVKELNDVEKISFDIIRIQEIKENERRRNGRRICR